MKRLSITCVYFNNFSGILDDFLHYRTTRQNELRSVTLHIAILANKRRNNGNGNSENEMYNDLQKVTNQKVM